MTRCFYKYPLLFFFLIFLMLVWSTNRSPGVIRSNNDDLVVMSESQLGHRKNFFSLLSSHHVSWHSTSCNTYIYIPFLCIFCVSHPPHLQVLCIKNICEFETSMAMAERNVFFFWMPHNTLAANNMNVESMYRLCVFLFWRRVMLKGSNRSRL